MSMTVSTEELHENTADVIARVARGEEVVIEQDGETVARLVPAPPAPRPRPRRRQFGTAAGMIEFKEGWDDPMTEEELAAWYDGPIFPDESASN